MAGGIPIYHALLPITEELTASSLTVTVDNDTFDLTSNGDGTYALGRLPNPSNPVGIYRKSGANYMALRDFDLGDHRVVIQEDTSSIETTECFKKAVKSVGSGVMMLNLVEGDPLSIEGATGQEAYDALQNGTMVFLTSDGVIFPCSSFDPSEIRFVHIGVRSDTSATASVTAYVYMWGSDGTITYIESTYPPQS